MALITATTPVVEDIAYLRTARPDLAGAALDALAAGDDRRALAVLLTDQDDWAPVGPPTVEEALAVVDLVDAGGSAVDAMRALHFGPVADYFAHRTSDATFLSALGLLTEAWPATPAPRVVELACGIGQVLRAAADAGASVTGVDVVFAKLWLARRFVVPDARLICADVTSAPLPLPAGSADLAVCHDALYFFDDKRAAVDELHRLAGTTGNVAIGHCHNALVDNLSAGRPLVPEGWAALLPDATLYDDEELGAAWLAPRRAVSSRPAQLHDAAAVAAIERRSPPVGVDVGAPRPGCPLRLNPLYAPADGDPVPLALRWPSARYEAEYGPHSDHLRSAAIPRTVLERAAAGEVDDEVAALARRRILVEAWP